MKVPSNSVIYSQLLYKDKHGSVTGTGKYDRQIISLGKGNATVFFKQILKSR